MLLGVQKNLAFFPSPAFSIHRKVHREGIGGQRIQRRFIIIIPSLIPKNVGSAIRAAVVIPWIGYVHFEVHDSDARMLLVLSEQS